MSNTVSYEERKREAAHALMGIAVVANEPTGRRWWIVSAGDESWSFPNRGLACAFANGWNESLKKRGERG